ncbi:MAG: hypothetical protein QOJ64_871 [Acidobacteriota bacterium]|nr:hypothetical protein [Acidobacteriota bacterium]
MKRHIKRAFVALLLPLPLLGCGGSQQNTPYNNSSPTTVVNQSSTPAAPTPTATPSSPTSQDKERPIEFTYLGITPDKQNIRYRIKVNTAKQISQVDLGVKFTDESGKVLDETTLIWQNIVRSKQQPIEKDKTYDVEGYLSEGATKAEVVLKRVVFADGTYWQNN